MDEEANLYTFEPVDNRLGSVVVLAVVVVVRVGIPETETENGPGIISRYDVYFRIGYCREYEEIAERGRNN